MIVVKHNLNIPFKFFPRLKFNVKEDWVFSLDYPYNNQYIIDSHLFNNEYSIPIF